MPDRIVISNTSPLVYLHQIGQIGLLRSLYGRVIVPQAVQDELHAGAVIGCAVPEVTKIPWIEVQPLTDRALLPAVVDLGLGEAEAIALSLSSPRSLLILDDALGRRIANSHRLTYTGTLGVLVKAKQEGFIARLAPLIEALRRTTMFLSFELIALVLAEAGEG